MKLIRSREKFETTQDIEQIKDKNTDISIYREIRNNNKERFDEAALLFLGNRITYTDLFEQADRVADILHAYGIGAGDMILTCVNGTPQTVSLLLACSKIGACAMMLTPRTTEEQLHNAVYNMNISLMFCMKNFYPVFAGMDSMDHLEQVVIMPVDTPIGKEEQKETTLSSVSNIIQWSDFMMKPAKERSVEVEGGDYPLAACSTTGSTGTPKYILHLNRSYVALSRTCKKVGWNWKPGDILFSIVPTFVATGISLVLLSPLALGVTILQEPRLNPFETFIFNLTEYKPQIVLATKSIWMSMAEHLAEQHFDLSSINYAFTVGKVISQKETNHINRFLQSNGCNSRLENMYGMSECNSILTYHSKKQRSDTSAGMALPGMKMERESFLSQ